MNNSSNVRRGFTLIELLVVIAIISILMSVLLPSLRQAKELAMGAICRSNLHSIGYTSALYLNEYDGTFITSYAWKDSGITADIANFWYFALAYYDFFEFSHPYIGIGDNAEILNCPIGKRESLKMPSASQWQTQSTYLRMRNDHADFSESRPFPSWGMGGDVKFDTIMRPGNQVFVIDGLYNNADQRRAGTYSGVMTDWTWSQTSMEDPTIPGRVGFLHSDRANSLFADQHVDAVELEELTEDMCNEPDGK